MNRSVASRTVSSGTAAIHLELASPGSTAVCRRGKAIHGKIRGYCAVPESDVGAVGPPGIAAKTSEAAVDGFTLTHTCATFPVGSIRKVLRLAIVMPL